MRFNDITAEAFCDYRISFWELLDRHNRINGYTVEGSDGVKGSMLHIEGRIWRAKLGSNSLEGTKAVVANWIVDKIANHE